MQKGAEDSFAPLCMAIMVLMKKIFSVAWVKERKILVGTVAVIAVIGFIIFIQVKENADYAKCIKQGEEEYIACLKDAETLTRDNPVEIYGAIRVCGNIEKMKREMCIYD